MFKVVNNKLILCMEREVKGAVYNLNDFNGYILAGINSRVQLFECLQKVIQILLLMKISKPICSSQIAAPFVCDFRTTSNWTSAHIVVMLVIFWLYMLKHEATSL